MRLLVSVSSPEEAAAAIAGGADVIDAKDPSKGALGAVQPDVFRTIYLASSVYPQLVTAALGDASDPGNVERAARAFVDLGAGLVKFGFAGVEDPGRVAALLAAAVKGASGAGDGRGGVVAVAYADAGHAGSLEPSELVAVASRVGARGVLIDTANKTGPGLPELVNEEALRRFVARAHAAGLFVAVAGQLTAENLPFVCESGADIVAVRSAACDGGRLGQVSASRVRHLTAILSAVVSRDVEHQS